MSRYRYEISPNQHSFRIYDNERGNMSYVASAMIQTNGSVGWVRQISGPVFFDVLFDNLDGILTTLGVSALEGPMNPAMIRAGFMKLKGRAKITVGEKDIFDGHELTWMKLERADNEAV